MAPAVPHVIANSSQAWKLIERDYGLRLSLVASEWAEEHLKAWNAVFAEGSRRRNSAYCGPALVEMEIADADKRAEWAVNTCYEIWGIQDREKCRPFFRAIFECCLQPMFSVREGCFRSELERHGTRTRREIPQGNSAILGQMKRQMNKLRAKWNTKLEIATGENEYQQQRSLQESQKRPTPTVIASSENNDQLTTAQLGAIASSLTWKELEIRFRDIEDEPIRRRLTADYIRTEWDSGRVTEEWIISGNPVRQTDFEQLILIAVRKLGCTASADANKHWLDRVREWMQERRLDKDPDMAWLPTGMTREYGETGTTQGLRTERIGELSAMFCMELIARGTPEFATWRSSEPSAIISSKAAKNGSGKTVGRKPTRDPEFVRVAGELWRSNQSPTKKVSHQALKRIGAALDQTPFSKPSDHLEGTAASELKDHNQKYGNSPKKILTWTDLIARNEPNFKGAMRRLLSRCAQTSGN